MMEDQKSVNVRLPLSVAKRLRREAFDREVSQGSIVADALELRWNTPAWSDEPVTR